MFTVSTAETMVRIINAQEAATLVDSGDTLLIGGSGAGHSVPDFLIEAIGKRFDAARADESGYPINFFSLNIKFLPSCCSNI